MDTNGFAKHNDLAAKMIRAINMVDRGNGWGVFEGLEKGETVVKVIYDGTVRFEAIPKPKPVKKKEPEPEHMKVLGLEVKLDPTQKEDAILMQPDARSRAKRSK